jgi:hypothetical protein
MKAIRCLLGIHKMRYLNVKGSAFNGLCIFEDPGDPPSDDMDLNQYLHIQKCVLCGKTQGFVSTVLFETEGEPITGWLRKADSEEMKLITKFESEE